MAEVLLLSLARATMPLLSWGFKTAATPKKTEQAVEFLAAQVVMRLPPSPPHPLSLSSLSLSAPVLSSRASPLSYYLPSLLPSLLSFLISSLVLSPPISPLILSSLLSYCSSHLAPLPRRTQLLPAAMAPLEVVVAGAGALPPRLERLATASLHVVVHVCRTSLLELDPCPRPRRSLSLPRPTLLLTRVWLSHHAAHPNPNPNPDWSRSSNRRTPSVRGGGTSAGSSAPLPSSAASRA